jgi:hypothetical protein
MDNNSPPRTLHVVPLSAQAEDRWKLRDPYIECVWSEHLGPTATLLARRLGRMLEERPGGVDFDLGDLATSLGVQPSIAVKALERLNRFEVVYFAREQLIVGVSGFAPSVRGARLFRLSEAGRVVHERLVEQSEAPRAVRAVSSSQAAVSRLSVPRVAPVQRRAL